VAGNSVEPGRSVADKVTSILSAFAERDALNLTEIARAANIPVSTAHRIASELLAWRLLERAEDGRIQVGLPLRFISKDATHCDVVNRAILVMRAQPALAQLAHVTAGKARLGVFSGGKVVTLCRGCGEGETAAAVSPVSARPVYETAIGKVLLAFASAGVYDTVFAVDASAPKPAQLRCMTSRIRINHYAIARAEHDDDWIAMAAPVSGGGGRIAPAIELAVRRDGADIRGALGALKMTSRSLSRQLATEFRGRGRPGPDGTDLTYSA
jgi:DNA-binding IclR family transcriptional regulator